MLHKNGIRFVKKSILTHINLFLTAVFTILLINIIGLGFPFLTGKFVDEITRGADLSGKTLYLLAGFGVIWFMDLLFRPLQSYILSKFVQTCIYDFSVESMKKFLSKDLHLFNTMKVGRLAKSADRGFGAYETLLTNICQSVIPNFLQLLVFSMVIIIWQPIFFFFTVGLSSLQVLISKSLIKKRRPLINNVNDAEDDMADEFHEALVNGLVIKIENQVNYAVERVKEPLKNYADSATKLAVSGSILNIVPPSFVNLTTISYLVFGLYQISIGSLTVGDLITLLSLGGVLIQIVGLFLNDVRQLDQFNLDIDEFDIFINQTEFERPGKELKDNFDLSISSFEVKRGDNKLIHLKKGLSIPHGQKVAIIGPTGGGKTTLLESLVGVDQSSRDHVSVGNQKISDLSSKAHLKELRYCPQKNYFQAGTVSESVFFKTYLSDEDKDLFSSLGLKDDFNDSSRTISSAGKNISGGEARRLSIARILSKPGAINFFDEPTAGLNESVEKLAWDKIFSGVRKNTLICVTHDYSILKEFERVLIISRGELIADCPPEELGKVNEYQSLIKKSN